MHDAQGWMQLLQMSRSLISKVLSASLKYVVWESETPCSIGMCDVGLPSLRKEVGKGSSSELTSPSTVSKAKLRLPYFSDRQKVRLSARLSFGSLRDFLTTKSKLAHYCAIWLHVSRHPCLSHELNPPLTLLPLLQITSIGPSRLVQHVMSRT